MCGVCLFFLVIFFSSPVFTFEGGNFPYPELHKGPLACVMI